MVRFFNNNQPYLVVALLLYTLALNAVLFIHPAGFILQEPESPLSRWLFSLLKMDYRLIACISITLVFVQALLITNLINKIKLFPRMTYVPGMAYVLAACMFREYLFLSPAMIANTFIILVIDQLFSMYKQQYAYREVFDTGLLIGLSSLIYFPSIVLLIAMFISLSLLRPLIWREWAISLLGLLTAYFLVITWCFWFDKLPYFIEQQFGSALFGFNSYVPVTAEVRVIGFILLTMIGSTFMIFQNNYLKSPIQIRKYLVITIWLLVLLMVSFLFEYTITLAHFVIISVPLSMILGYFLVNIRRKRVAEGVHLVLLLAVLFFQYYQVRK